MKMVKQNLKMVKYHPPIQTQVKVMSILHVPIKTSTQITQHGLYTGKYLIFRICS